ncbi:MAG: hypothetical protein RIR00_1351 [Pseudomonadota bacterium]|jgi:RimJ/RimL family protein N-acetyltransferase
MTAPLPFLASERLLLRPLCPEDADGAYPRWLNDQEVCAGNAHGLFPYSRDDARAFIAQASGPDRLVLAIVLKDGQRHIGNLALQQIHRIYRSAEFAILLGERDCHGQGYAAEAGRLLLRHGFQRLNLHRIGCGTFAGNQGMIRLAAALGMVEEGRRREAAFVAGHHQDILEFGVLRQEFLHRYP